MLPKTNSIKQYYVRNNVGAIRERTRLQILHEVKEDLQSYINNYELNDIEEVGYARGIMKDLMVVLSFIQDNKGNTLTLEELKLIYAWSYVILEKFELESWH